MLISTQNLLVLGSLLVFMQQQVRPTLVSSGRLVYYIMKLTCISVFSSVSLELMDII